MVEERMSRSQVAINVKKLLRKNPNLRDDDTALVLAYWREFNGARIEITSTKPLTNFCSIIRRRQEIQESGKFLPTKEKVRRKRGKRE